MAKSAAKTIQTGLVTNTKNYTNFGYFVNGIDTTHQNLDQFNPYIKGRSRIFMYRAPYFMEKLFPNKTKSFKSYIETGYTKVDGIQDLTVEFVEFEGGFNGQKFSNVSTSKDDTNTLTISLYEQSGSPVREFIETWITGVRDPRSGIAHYHGALDGGIDETGASFDPIRYGEINHTAEFIYYVLDPTAKNIEYACMFAHAMPTKVTKDHYNYEKGDNGEVLLDIEFMVNKYESTYINDIAKYYRDVDNLRFSYLNFNPNISKKDVNDAYILDLHNGYSNTNGME